MNSLQKQAMSKLRHHFHAS